MDVLPPSALLPLPTNMLFCVYLLENASCLLADIFLDRAV